MNALVVLAKGTGLLLTAGNSWLWARVLHGHGLYVHHSCKIIGYQSIQIGSGFRAGRMFWLEALSRYGQQRFLPSLVIGNRVICGDAVHIACTKSIVIGDDVLIGSNVHITDHNHGRYHGDGLQSSPDEAPTTRLLEGSPVVIEEKVFLADGVVVLPGSHIGAGTVVGANAVVSGALPARTICVGSPARPIKAYSNEASAWVDVNPG